MNLLKRTSALLLVGLVLGTTGCSQTSSDAGITSRVKTAIAKEPGLKGTTVDVSTDKKVVQLSGTVKSRAERAMLISVARKVEGVEAVKTDLTVQAEQQKKLAAKPQPKRKVEARAKREPRAQRLVAQPEVKFEGTGR